MALNVQAAAVGAASPDIRDDHARNIAHWLTALKADKRAIREAASYAQKAEDFLQGLQPKSMERAA